VSGTPQCPTPPGTDEDRDGYCADVDPFDADVAGNDKKVPETSAFSSQVCDDDKDNDVDTFIDLSDPGCSDLDNDGVLNQFDNCPQTPNGLSQAGDPGVGNQTDSDGDSAGTGNIGEQPFRRSSTGVPDGPPTTVVGEPFRRSDQWGGNACDPDDDNDGLPDGNEPAGCELKPDCDDDVLGDYPEWKYSPLNQCFVFNDCLIDPPTITCLDPLVINDRLQNDDGDSLFTWGEALIGTDPCTSTSDLAGDLDGDGFNKGIELYALTDPNSACALTTTKFDEADDRWLVDTNDDQGINTFDVVPYIAALNSVSPSPPFTRRLDLNANGNINTFDLVPFILVLNTVCSP